MSRIYRLFGVGFCYTHLHPAFKDLAERTSGQTISLRKDGELEKLNNLTAGVLDGTSTLSIGSSPGHKRKRSVKNTTPRRYNFSVDESIEKLTITVSTTRQGTNGLYFFFFFDYIYVVVGEA